MKSIDKIREFVHWESGKNGYCKMCLADFGSGIYSLKLLGDYGTLHEIVFSVDYKDSVNMMDFDEFCNDHTDEDEFVGIVRKYQLKKDYNQISNSLAAAVFN